jgi:hypothetical protein
MLEMKNNSLLFLLFSLSMNAMQHDDGMRALCTAIQKSDVQQFEKLARNITNPETHGLESMRLLLSRSLPETHQIERESTTMKKLTQERARNLCNASFYKNLSISIACFGTAACLAGLFIAIPVVNQEFDFLKNGLTIGSSVSILTALGVKHFKNACTNEDAVNEYAKQLAIKYFVKKITGNHKEPI